MLKLRQPQPTYEQGYEAGLNYARKRLEASKLPLFSEGGVHSISGKIITADAAGVTVEYDLSSIDLFKEGVVQKKAVLADGGVIERYLQKTQEELAKELKSSKKSVPPAFFTVQELSFQDLRKDDLIRIQSDSDILNADIIQAKAITLLSRPPEKQLLPPEALGQDGEE